jgi:20S proteasome alpha/beta subunit
MTIKSTGIMWAGHVVHVGDTRNRSKILIKKREGKRLSEGHRHRWEKIFK